MRRLLLPALLLLLLAVPCLAEEAAHLGMPYFSFTLPAGFEKSMGPSVSGGTLKTTSYAWKRREGSRTVTVRADLSTFSGTLEDAYRLSLGRMRQKPSDPKFARTDVKGERLPGGLWALHSWFAYADKWEYRTTVLAAPGRIMTFSAWNEEAKKSGDLKTLVDGIVATVKNLP